MKKTLVVIMLLLSTLMLFSMLPRHVKSTSFTTVTLRNNVEPYKVEDFEGTPTSYREGQIPFNVDMVDAELSSNQGNGIYVAVLDTGLLSNYLYYLPPSKVDIKEEWGIGFTHDVFYVGSGGNWSDDGKFSYGPLRSDRGFITHDIYNPDKNGFGWGSGHGTHVTSIITGYRFVRSPVDTWIAGVAPKVTIIPVLVLDDWIEFEPKKNGGDGWFWRGGTDEMVAAGIRYIGDLAKTYNVKIVINMSLGGPGFTQEELDAINYAISQGVIIVASAGNEGYDGMGWPGAFPQVISAAAAGWTQEYGGGYYNYYWWWNNVPEKLNTPNYVYDGTTGVTYNNNWQTYLCDFSSRPNKALGQDWKDLDVAAPGAAIRGPYKGYGPTLAGYSAVWGTSQAAPHVSAIAALILQSYPDLVQSEMEGILKNAAKGLPMPADGAVVSDVFGAPAPPYPVWFYWWNDHEAGEGFLTYSLAKKAAQQYFKAR